MWNHSETEVRKRLAVGLLTITGLALLAIDAYWIRMLTVEAVDIPTSVFITVCGDGVVGATEVCDDGLANNTGVYGSSTAARTCAPGCHNFGPYCGDAVLQVRFTEGCDDGNNTSGDLCSATCSSETAITPSPSGGGGSPPVGSVAPVPGADPGGIDGLTPTKVVLRGKAYPNASVAILLDGKSLGTTQADANADFLYTSNDVTPGVASFGFISTDVNGVSSITTSAIFNIVQSAITTVSNIFIPPSIEVSKSQIKPGDLFTFSGQSVPFAKIKAEIFAKTTSKFSAEADATGLWALQVDSKSLSEGAHTAKAFFEITNEIKSGYGRSVNFSVGTVTAAASCGAPDLNDDTKVNLVDFSIFLLSWNTTDPKADFNCDRAVNLADFSIMLFNWTG